MSQGNKAGEEVKGVFKGIGDVTEGLRKNINSFADDLMGSKSGTHSNAADGTHQEHSSHGFPGLHGNKHHQTTGTTTTGTAGAPTTGPGSHFGRTHETGTTGFSRDAEVAGEAARQTVNDAGAKIGGHNNTTTGSRY